MENELTNAPWLKRMTTEEFEVWWSQGRIAREWLTLTQTQKAQAANIKLLFKDIVIQKDVDIGAVFALMGLACDLYRELIKRTAYEEGWQSVWRKHHSDFLKALRSFRENPFAPHALKFLSADWEPVVGKAIHLTTTQIRQREKTLASRTKKPEIFVRGLIFLDSMPGAKTRYLRSFFACLFVERLKTNRKNLVGRIIHLCFRERLTAKGLKQSRADFRKSFPNWRGIAEQLFQTFKSPTPTLSVAGLTKEAE